MTIENSEPVPSPQKCKYELCMTPAVSPTFTNKMDDLCSYHREQARFIMWLFSKMKVQVQVQQPPPAVAGKLVVPGIRILNGGKRNGDR